MKIFCLIYDDDMIYMRKLCASRISVRIFLRGGATLRDNTGINYVLHVIFKK
jgi:hypothetical protein